MSRSATVSLAAALCLCSATWSDAQQADAISREVTAFNDLTNPATARDAASREVSVYNNLSPPTVFVDAVSHEASVFNDLIGLFTKDVVSREVSLQNAFGCPTELHGNFSGNLTDDGLVTSADIGPFVDVLLGVISDSYLEQAADVNCDTFADGRDIAPFVSRILGS